MQKRAWNEQWIGGRERYWQVRDAEGIRDSEYRCEENRLSHTRNLRKPTPNCSPYRGDSIDGLKSKVHREIIQIVNSNSATSNTPYPLRSALRQGSHFIFGPPSRLRSTIIPQQHSIILAASSLRKVAPRKAESPYNCSLHRLWSSYLNWNSRIDLAENSGELIRRKFGRVYFFRD